MHEFSLVSAVIDSLEPMAVENGWGAVKKVTLRVGAMRQVFPEVMKFAFAAASAGTALAGAELELIEVPIRIECPDCRKSWGDEHMGLVCPFCGSSNAQMAEGMELDIDSVEVEENGASES